MTEDEMVGWHHWLNGHAFEQTLGVGDRQGSLACWDRKELDTTEQLNWTDPMPQSSHLLCPHWTWNPKHSSSSFLPKEVSTILSASGAFLFFLPMAGSSSYLRRMFATQEYPYFIPLMFWAFIKTPVHFYIECILCNYFIFFSMNLFAFFPLLMSWVVQEPHILVFHSLIWHTNGFHWLKTSLCTDNLVWDSSVWWRLRVFFPFKKKIVKFS